MFSHLKKKNFCKRGNILECPYCSTVAYNARSFLKTDATLQSILAEIVKLTVVSHIGSHETFSSK